MPLCGEASVVTFWSFYVFFVFALAGDGSVQFLPQERGLETAVVLIFESSRDTHTLHTALGGSQLFHVF